MKKTIAVITLAFSGFAFGSCPTASPGYQLVQVPDYWQLYQIVSIDSSQVFPPNYLPDEKTCMELVEDGRPLPERCYCDNELADPDDCIEKNPVR